MLKKIYDNMENFTRELESIVKERGHGGREYQLKILALKNSIAEIKKK